MSVMLSVTVRKLNEMIKSPKFVKIVSDICKFKQNNKGHKLFSEIVMVWDREATVEGFLCPDFKKRLNFKY